MKEKPNIMNAANLNFWWFGSKINHFLIDDINFDISFEYEINNYDNGNEYKSNNNLFDINIKENSRTNKIQRIYTFNVTKYDIPNEIVVKVKDGNTERNITFIKDENT